MFKITRKVRDLAEQRLGYKLKINDKIRAACQQDISLDEFVRICVQNKNYKREVIPLNMRYNRHTRDYWQKNPGGTKKECIQIWYKIRDLEES